MANTVSKLLKVSKKEVGYLEKRSNKSLNSKTANAGYNNYTKYWAKMRPSYQGQPWCDCFVSWCFLTAFGAEAAQKLLCGGLYSYYTPTSAQCFKSKNRWKNGSSKPKTGWQIFFKNSSGGICHTGIVRAVKNGRVYTREGNTSASSGVVANGGGVTDKSYPIGYSRIAGYGVPDFDYVVGYKINATRYLYKRAKIVKKERIVKIPKGSKVTYLKKKSGNFRYVKYKGKKGYICRTKAGKVVIKSLYD